MRAKELHLARLLEAVEGCSVHMQASARRLPWPLSGEFLHAHRKAMDLFEAASAFNERFSKLQDTLGAAMRHAALLATAGRLLERRESQLGILPATDDFSAELRDVLTRSGAAV